MHSVFTIREAAPDATGILEYLSVTTFMESYAAHNTAENMALYIAEHFNKQQIANELSDTGNIFFVVMTDGIPAGYVKLRAGGELQEPEHKNAIEIERIYVLREHQGKQAGAMLMQHSITYAAQNGYDTLWLGVWEHNHKAIAFYKRWGFEEFGSHIFTLGCDQQTDLLLKKSINSN